MIIVDTRKGTFLTTGSCRLLKPTATAIFSMMQMDTLLVLMSEEF